jgi:glycosyltransferase involved in cell wall biosynthesis
LQAAKGKYILFLDADDVIHPKKFEIQVNKLAVVRQLAMFHSDYFKVL